MDEKRDDELNCPVCRGKFTLNEGKDTTSLETYLYSIDCVSNIHMFYNKVYKRIQTYAEGGHAMCSLRFVLIKTITGIFQYS